MSFVDDDGGAQRILSKECYQHWVSTRKCVLKQPEESFRRVLTAHVGGLDGRRPFPEKVEQSLLKILRKREVWECFRGTGVSIGSRGYRNAGYHESLASEAKKRDKQLFMQQQQQHNQAMAAYTHQLQMQLWELQQRQEQQTHEQLLQSNPALNAAMLNHSLNGMLQPKGGFRKQTVFHDSRVEQSNPTQLGLPFNMPLGGGMMQPHFQPQYSEHNKVHPLPVRTSKQLPDTSKFQQRDAISSSWLGGMHYGQVPQQPLPPSLDLTNSIPKYAHEQTLR